MRPSFVWGDWNRLWNRLWLVIGFAAVWAAAPSARAQTDYPQDRDYGQEPYLYGDEGTFSLRTGLGFTASPTAFLLGFEGDYRVAEPISIGALVELGIDDDLTIVSPVVFARYWPDLGELIDPDLAPIEPYLHAGLGFTWWDADGYKGIDDDDAEFLLNFGFGLEYRFTENVSLGSQMLFNIMPAEVFDDSRIDDRFYYSWEVAGIRYRF